MLYVERQMSNTLQADVLCFGAENLQIFLNVDRSKAEIPEKLKFEI